MRHSDRRSRILAQWIYLPGILMILLGTSIFIFPHLFVSIVAGCFILAGLLLIQCMRTLRRAAARVRSELEVDQEQVWEIPAEGLLPRRVFTTYIN